MTSRFSAIDLFCGSGAVTEALQRCGFEVKCAIDNDPVACNTFRLNHPSVNLFEQDITAVDVEGLRLKVVGPDGVDLMVVCAPCQPFSSQNRKRGKDKRGTLIFEAVRFARVLRPRCIFFENVSGLASGRNSSLIRKLGDELQDLGYYLSKPRRVNASDLGVPQRRIRCVMLAAPSKGAIAMFESAQFNHATCTVRDVIGDLPPLQNGESDPHDPLHFARVHSSIVIARLSNIPPDGGSRSALPDHLTLSCHRGRESKSFSDVYGRMKWDDVAPTLTSGCTDVTRGRYAHPEQHRAITLREAAQLQTFPRSYQFVGTRRQIATQIGNAVPIAMLEAMLPSIREVLFCPLPGSVPDMHMGARS